MKQLSWGGANREDAQQQQQLSFHYKCDPQQHKTFWIQLKLKWKRLLSVKVGVRTNLDFISPSEAFELPKPHVLRLHPPLPAGGTFLRALPCQHHDQPADEQQQQEDEVNKHWQTSHSDIHSLLGLLDWMWGWNINKPNVTTTWRSAAD